MQLNRLMQQQQRNASTLFVRYYFGFRIKIIININYYKWKFSLILLVFIAVNCTQVFATLCILSRTLCRDCIISKVLFATVSRYVLAHRFVYFIVCNCALILYVEAAI